MKKIYDATDDYKREIILIENEDLIYRRSFNPTIEDLVLVRSTNIFPTNGIVFPSDYNGLSAKKTSNWTLNGVTQCGKDFLIIEPLQEQLNNPTIENISETDTWFTGEVTLSKKSIILMSEESYKMLCNSKSDFREKADKYNIVLYRGDENLALKMVLYNKRYVSFDLCESGFMQADEYGDSLEYINQLRKIEEQITVELQKMGRDVTYGKTQEYDEEENIENKTYGYVSTIRQDSEETLYIDAIKKQNSKMITGLTPAVEGDIELDEECYATTSIGKIRENQEDAILLIKDRIIAQFKMMVVADGMGGEQNGEIASHIIVTKLKEWFETLSREEKEDYYIDVEKLEEDLKAKIQEISFDIEWDLHRIRRSNNSLCNNW